MWGKVAAVQEELKSELSNSVMSVPAGDLFRSHRKLSSVATKENPLKALLALALAVNSGVRLTELETISLVNSGSMCWVSAGPFCKKQNKKKEFLKKIKIEDLKHLKEK